MKLTYKVFVLVFTSLLIFNINTASASAKLDNRIKMMQQLDLLDQMDFQDRISEAGHCTIKRDFLCADNKIKKAKKLAKSSKDKKLVLSAIENLGQEVREVEREIEIEEENIRKRQAAERRRQKAEENARKKSNSGGSFVQAFAFGSIVAIAAKADITSEQAFDTITAAAEDIYGDGNGSSLSALNKRATSELQAQKQIAQKRKALNKYRNRRASSSSNINQRTKNPQAAQASYDSSFGYSSPFDSNDDELQAIWKENADFLKKYARGFNNKTLANSRSNYNSLVNNNSNSLVNNGFNNNLRQNSDSNSTLRSANKQKRNPDNAESSWESSQTTKSKPKSKSKCVAKTESGGSLPSGVCGYVYADYSRTLHFDYDDYEKAGGAFMNESGSRKGAESSLYYAMLKKAKKMCKSDGYTDVFLVQDLSERGIESRVKSCKNYKRMTSTFYLCRGSSEFFCARYDR